MGVVDAILEDDTQAPPKEATRPRIFDRLRDETATRQRVTVRRDSRCTKERVPRSSCRSHSSGEAQFDFGEATVEIEGSREGRTHRERCMAMKSLESKSLVLLRHH